MRALIDTNVFISYLLSPHRTDAIQRIFVAHGEGAFTLLMPEALLEEISVTVTAKPRLSTKITLSELQQFITDILVLAEIVPRIESNIPAVTRDPKDDYLLAYALVGDADYLVTGDKDLLVLKEQLEEIQIVTPHEFNEIVSPLE